MISSDSSHCHSIAFSQVRRATARCLRSNRSFAGYRHVHLYTIGGDLIANAYLFVHIVIHSKSLAVVCLFLCYSSFIDQLLLSLCEQKPRRSLSRYRRSLTRRKLRVAAFRSIGCKQIDDLFKVGKSDILSARRSLLSSVGGATVGDGIRVSPCSRTKSR